MTDARKNKLKKTLQNARCRMLKNLAGFALPLGIMTYVATKDVRRMSTNGKCIYFDPDWLSKLADDELDFMLAHQLMHIQLGHIERPAYYRGARFHLACDIVANSYLELLGFEHERLPHIGKIFCRTFYPEVDGRLLFAKEAVKYVPFDPAVLSPGAARGYVIDSDEWWERTKDCGENGTIVLEDGEIDFLDTLYTPGLSVAPFNTPYETFESEVDKKKRTPADSYRELKYDSWEKMVADNLSTLRSLRSDYRKGRGDELVQRVWKKVDATYVDWRKILRHDIQCEVFDYSFQPPDRRYSDCDYFLPDYNVPADKQRDVLLFVDTSASIGSKELDLVLSEIYSLVNQFGGGIDAYLCFFDTCVYKPIHITDAMSLCDVVPVGGGATDYNCVIDYAKKSHKVHNIIIFTDGSADFPKDNDADDLPVIWMFTKPCVAPWGKSVVLN